MPDAMICIVLRRSRGSYGEREEDRSFRCQVAAPRPRAAQTDTTHREAQHDPGRRIRGLHLVQQRIYLAEGQILRLDRAHERVGDGLHALLPSVALEGAGRTTVDGRLACAGTQLVRAPGGVGEAARAHTEATHEKTSVACGS